MPGDYTPKPYESAAEAEARLRAYAAGQKRVTDLRRDVAKHNMDKSSEDTATRAQQQAAGYEAARKAQVEADAAQRKSTSEEIKEAGGLWKWLHKPNS